MIFFIRSFKKERNHFTVGVFISHARSVIKNILHQFYFCKSVTIMHDINSIGRFGRFR